MINKKIKLNPGQNLRYNGKGFRGYIKGLPYMVFIAYKGINNVLVKYNNSEVIVSRNNADPVG